MTSLVRIWIVLLPAIIAAYFLVDRPLAQALYDLRCPQETASLAGYKDWPPFVRDTPKAPKSEGVLCRMVEAGGLMTGFAPLLLLSALLLPAGRGRDLLILTGVSLLVTFVLKNDLKWVFGRYWPITWTNGNLSWISDHAYGFHWFRGNFLQGEECTGSFPSGHTAMAFALLIPVGLFHRKLLPLLVLAASTVGLLLVLLDYHFLSDVLAGALLGITCPLLLQRLFFATGPIPTGGDREGMGRP